MMKFLSDFLLLLLALLLPPDLVAEPFQCRPYTIVANSDTLEPDKFNQGLLWQISRGDRIYGYVFGTIHVDDPDILDLPAEVARRLDDSTRYVMEMVPADDDLQTFSQAMFFQDGQRLDQLLSPDTYTRTLAILENYSMSPEVATLLKPWAAFMLMSYPDNMQTVLDMSLLERARRNGAAISGLETIDEQIDIFSHMSLSDQTRILTDTVCHYENTGEDFSMMKSLYRARDLEALANYGQRYRFEDNSAYDAIHARLIVERNRRMVDRLEPLLGEGVVFVAVGAMHLPGDQGILNLLEKRDFTLTPVY